MIEKKPIVHFVRDIDFVPICDVSNWKYNTNCKEVTTCKNCLRCIEREKETKKR